MAYDSTADVLRTIKQLGAAQSSLDLNPAFQPPTDAGFDALGGSRKQSGDVALPDAIPTLPRQQPLSDDPMLKALQKVQDNPVDTSAERAMQQQERFFAQQQAALARTQAAQAKAAAKDISGVDAVAGMTDVNSESALAALEQARAANGMPSQQPEIDVDNPNWAEVLQSKEWQRLPYAEQVKARNQWTARQDELRRQRLIEAGYDVENKQIKARLQQYRAINEQQSALGKAPQFEWTNNDWWDATVNGAKQMYHDWRLGQGTDAEKIAAQRGLADADAEWQRNKSAKTLDEEKTLALQRERLQRQNVAAGLPPDLTAAQQVQMGESSISMAPARMLLASLPGTLLGAGAAIGGAAAGALASPVGSAVAGAAAGAAVGSQLSLAGTAGQIYDSINNTSDSDLEVSPRYQQLLQTYGGDKTRAKQQLINEAVDASKTESQLIGAAIGTVEAFIGLGRSLRGVKQAVHIQPTIVSKVLNRFGLVDKSPQSALKQFASHIGTPAGGILSRHTLLSTTEEMGQEAAEEGAGQIAANRGQQAVGLNVGTFDGAIENATQGALLGAGMNVGGIGVRKAYDRALGPQQTTNGEYMAKIGADGNMELIRSRKAREDATIAIDQNTGLARMIDPTKADVADVVSVNLNNRRVIDGAMQTAGLDQPTARLVSQAAAQAMDGNPQNASQVFQIQFPEGTASFRTFGTGGIQLIANDPAVLTYAGNTLLSARKAFDELADPLRVFYSRSNPQYARGATMAQIPENVPNTPSTVPTQQPGPMPDPYTGAMPAAAPAAPAAQAPATDSDAWLDGVTADAEGFAPPNVSPSTVPAGQDKVRLFRSADMTAGVWTSDAGRVRGQAGVQMAAVPADKLARASAIPAGRQPDAPFFRFTQSESATLPQDYPFNPFASAAPVASRVAVEQLTPQQSQELARQRAQATPRANPLAQVQGQVAAGTQYTTEQQVAAVRDEAETKYIEAMLSAATPEQASVAAESAAQAAVNPNAAADFEQAIAAVDAAVRATRIRSVMQTELDRNPGGVFALQIMRAVDARMTANGDAPLSGEERQRLFRVVQAYQGLVQSVNASLPSYTPTTPDPTAAETAAFIEGNVRERRGNTQPPGANRATANGSGAAAGATAGGAGGTVDGNQPSAARPAGSQPSQQPTGGNAVASVGQPADATGVQPAADSGGNATAANAAGRATASAVAPTARQVVLQNRQRNTAASIDQMSEIASRPDYLRAGVSTTLDQGAPVVFGDVPAGAPLGRIYTLTDNTGRRIVFQYAVVDSRDVITSNQADGTPIAAYATGQPGKLRAIAGNGRSAGITEAWNRGTADEYRSEMLADADNTGVNAASAARVARPQLVRVIAEKDVTPDMGDRSNVAATARMSPVETAANDAQRIDLTQMEFDDDGNPTPATISQFLASMPVGERGDMMNADGTPTRQLIDRITTAVFKQAYGSDALVQLYGQAIDPVSRNVMAALAQSAGGLSQLSGAGEFDIRAAVAGAAEMAVNARLNSKTLADVLRTVGIDENTEVVAVARFFAENNQTPRRMADGLSAWVNFVLAQLGVARANENQTGLFGPAPTPTRNEIFGALNGTQQPTQTSAARASQPGRDQPVDQGAQPAAAQRTGNGGSASNNGAGQGTAPFELTPTTPEGLRAQAAETAQRDAAARQAQQDADRRAAADAGVGEFRLTGSDRASDANSDQGDMFSAPPATQTPMEVLANVGVTPASRDALLPLTGEQEPRTRKPPPGVRAKLSALETQLAKILTPDTDAVPGGGMAGEKVAQALALLRATVIGDSVSGIRNAYMQGDLSGYPMLQRARRALGLHETTGRNDGQWAALVSREVPGVNLMAQMAVDPSVSEANASAAAALAAAYAEAGVPLPSVTYNSEALKTAQAAAARRKTSDGQPGVRRGQYSQAEHRVDVDGDSDAATVVHEFAHGLTANGWTRLRAAAADGDVQAQQVVALVTELYGAVQNAHQTGNDALALAASNPTEMLAEMFRPQFIAWASQAPLPRLSEPAAAALNTLPPSPTFLSALRSLWQTLARALGLQKATTETVWDALARTYPVLGLETQAYQQERATRSGDLLGDESADPVVRNPDNLIAATQGMNPYAAQSAEGVPAARSAADVLAAQLAGESPAASSNIRKLLQKGQRQSGTEGLAETAIETFVDYMRPMVRWIRGLEGIDATAKQDMEGAMRTAAPRRDALAGLARTEYGAGEIVDLLGRLVNRTGHTAEAVMNRAGYWSTARWSLEKNARWLRTHRDAVEEAGEAVAQAQKAYNTEAEAVKPNAKAVQLAERRLTAAQAALGVAQAELNSFEQALNNPAAAGRNVDSQDNDVGLVGGLNDAQARAFMADAETQYGAAEMQQLGDLLARLNAFRVALDLESGRLTPQQAARYSPEMADALPLMEAVQAAAATEDQAELERARNALVEQLQTTSHYVPTTGDPDTMVDETTFGIGVKTPNTVADRRMVGRVTSVADNAIKTSLEAMQRSAQAAGWLPFNRRVLKAFDSMSPAQRAKAKMHEVPSAAQGLLRIGDSAIIVGQRAVSMGDSQALESIRRSNVDERSSMWTVIDTPTRWFAYGATQMSLFFGPINWVRDVWERSEILRQRTILRADGTQIDSQRAANRARAIGANPRMLRELMAGMPMVGKASAAALNSPTMRLLRQFEEAGGSASRRGETLSRSTPDLMKDITSIRLRPLKAFKAIGQVIGHWNAAFDSMAALGAYQALMEQGLTSDAAAAQTLDLMNFRKMGTMTPALRALWAFVNPAVQGGVNLARMYRSNGKWNKQAFVRTAGYMIVLGALQTALAAMAGIDDETGKNKIDEMDSYAKDKSIPLPIPGGGVVKIPLGFGMPQMANTLMRIAREYAVGDKTMLESLGGLVDRAVLPQFTWFEANEISMTDQPMQKLVTQFAPTVFSPIASVAMNTNSYGGEIVKKALLDPNLFSSMQGAPNTPGFYTDVAQTVRQLTGVDYAPEQVREIMRGYSVGILRSMLNGLVENPAKEALGRPTNNPLTSQIYINEFNPNAGFAEFQNFTQKAIQIQRRVNADKTGDGELTLPEDERQILALYQAWGEQDKKFRAAGRKLTLGGIENGSAIPERKALEDARRSYEMNLLRTYNEIRNN